MKDNKNKKMRIICQPEDMVGMGELKLLQNDECAWAVLGSCVGLVLYDAVSKVGGVAHIMLQKNERKDNRIGKYADTAVPALIDLMIKNGAERKKIKARIVGGANMFKWKSAKIIMDIGTDNVNSVREELEKENITILKSMTGGNSGYKIIFAVSDGIVHIEFIDGRKIEL